MASSSRVIDLHFRKHFRKQEDRQRAQSRANMRPPTRRLHESEEEGAYANMLASAVQFFEHKQDETVTLPPDSPEKMFIEAIMGVLKQYQSNGDEQNTDLREKASTLAERLRTMFEGKKASEEMSQYIDKLREGLIQYHNSVSPVGGSPGPDDMSGPGPEGGEGGDKPDGDKPKPEPEERPPPPEGPDIAKKLGL